MTAPGLIGTKNLKRSPYRRPRHAGLNDIICRALVASDVPAILEQNGLRDDNKKPYKMSLIPWRLGKPLAWGATFVDTLTAFRLQESEVGTGHASEHAERLKRHKHEILVRLHV